MENVNDIFKKPMDVDDMAIYQVEFIKQFYHGGPKSKIYTVYIPVPLTFKYKKDIHDHIKWILFSPHSDEQIVILSITPMRYTYHQSEQDKAFSDFPGV